MEDKNHRGRRAIDTVGLSNKTALQTESGQEPNTTLGAGDNETPFTKVPVNEDYLFDVDIPNRELGPTFWLGNVYDVRRGTWFFVEGANLRPCDENLAVQLEEGYLRTKPWKSTPSHQSVASRPRTVSVSSESHDMAQVETSSFEAGTTTKEPHDIDDTKGTHTQPSGQAPLLTHRMFGAYMNSIVTYQDASTAWLLTDDFLSKVSSSVYQRFAGGAHLSGTKLVRGYTDPAKRRAKDAKRPQTPPPPSSRVKGTDIASSGDVGKDKQTRRLSVPSPSNTASPGEPSTSDGVLTQQISQPEPRLRSLERQMSSLVANVLPEDPGKQDEDARKREEDEIRDDYEISPGDVQDREIEHLVLVTHGIGQRLGQRFDSFNFIHDVNELRKTLKSVYAASADLQVLNSELDGPLKNCRIQVLPICWRQLLNFPRQGVKEHRREHDLADAEPGEEDKYPSLQDITVEGVPALRNIVADLALDILLYQNATYKDHISRIVASEANRIYGIFKERNPSFRGKVSLIGHSLGSAVFFDVISDQVKVKTALEKGTTSRSGKASDISLDFDVENMFCLGSPLGLFQMLKGKTIAGRPHFNEDTSDGTLEGGKDSIVRTSHMSSKVSSPYSTPPTTGSTSDPITSAPKCRELFNIFHPSDPIAYRLEPLITPAMSSLKPQPLPYTKKGIFGTANGQGFTGIPARLGQSVSGMWSNFSSGLTNTFINRSLGISAADAAKLSTPTAAPQQDKIAHSLGAGTNIVSGGVISAVPSSAVTTNSTGDEKKRRLSTDPQGLAHVGDHPPTLLDSEIETLYLGFQKRRKSSPANDGDSAGFAGSPASQNLEEHEQKLRREEAKVRALNSNGRVDYSIQEWVSRSSHC